MPSLEMLKVPDVPDLSEKYGLVVDRINGPKTRAAMHGRCLMFAKP